MDFWKRKGKGESKDEGNQDEQGGNCVCGRYFDTDKGLYNHQRTCAVVRNQTQVNPMEMFKGMLDMMTEMQRAMSNMSLQNTIDQARALKEVSKEFHPDAPEERDEWGDFATEVIKAMAAGKKEQVGELAASGPKSPQVQIHTVPEDTVKQVKEAYLKGHVTKKQIKENATEAGIPPDLIDQTLKKWDNQKKGGKK